MTQILRVLLTLIGTCILLVLVAVIGLVVFVNPNDLKPQISQAVSKYTGRQLQLGGNIEWSLFPWLGLQLNDAKLSNTPGFGNKPFAEIQKLDIQVRLLPLFHKQLEVGKLHINGLALHLVKNLQGQTNWQITPSATSEIPQTTTDTISNNLRPLSFGVAGLEIQNGQIFFDDLQKNKHYEISQLQLKSNDLTVNKSSPFFVKFNLKSNTPKLEAAVKMSSDITLNSDGKTLVLNKINFDTLLKDPAYPKGILPIALQGDANFNLNDQSFAADKFIAVINQNKLIGNIKGQNIFSNPSFKGTVITQQLKAGQLTIQQIQLPFQFKNNILSLIPITGKLYQGNYQGNATINFTALTPLIVAQGQLTQLNTQALFQEFNNKSQIQLAGLANVTFKLTTQGGDENTLLKNLHGQGQFNLDNGTIKGINLSYWVAMGKALLKHEPRPTSTTSDTPFNKFMGSFTIDKGIMVNNDLNVISGRLRINGLGSVNLPQQQINYEINAQPILSDGSPDGIAIPIKISGQFNNIHIIPVLDKLSIDIVKEKLKGKLQEQLKKLDLKKLFQ
ncbi:MAG: AsmA family protein [Rickettsiella sp.]|nr:AsmA family protein [Rickettsiella sp.]